MCIYFHMPLKFIGIYITKHKGRGSAVIRALGCQSDQCCGTLKAVGNTDHTRQTWIHMQTSLYPLGGCGPVGEGTSGNVLNWTVRSLITSTTTTIYISKQFIPHSPGLLVWSCISLRSCRMFPASRFPVWYPSHPQSNSHHWHND